MSICSFTAFCTALLVPIRKSKPEHGHVNRHGAEPGALFLAAVETPNFLHRNRLRRYLQRRQLGRVEEFLQVFPEGAIKRLFTGREQPVQMEISRLGLLVEDLLVGREQPSSSFYVPVAFRISQWVDVFSFPKVAPIPTTDSITSVDLSRVLYGKWNANGPPTNRIQPTLIKACPTSPW